MNNFVNQVRIIIPNSGDEQYNRKKPSLVSIKNASGSSKGKVHFYDYMAALATADLRHSMSVTYVGCLLYKMRAPNG